LAHDKPKVVEYLIDNNMIDIVNCMNRSPSSFNQNQISTAANGQTVSTNAQTIDSTKQWSKIIEGNKFKKNSYQATSYQHDSNGFLKKDMTGSRRQSDLNTFFCTDKEVH
jgi:hypothetical protein